MKVNTAVICAVVVALGLSSTAFGQGASADDRNAANAAQALINGHTAWESKLSSTGASIQVKEIERQGSTVKYHLFVSGLPGDELYTVISWPVTQQKPAPLIRGASLGKNGIVMCAGRTQEQCGDPSKKDDPIDFVFNPAKGEPLRIALMSGENRAAVVIVPNPIADKDKDCTLSAVRLLPHFELVYFTGSGFPANIEVTFDSQSYDEKHPVKTKADGNGNIKFALMPFVAGRSKGTTTLRGTGMNCSPVLKFDWGQ